MRNIIKEIFNKEDSILIGDIEKFIIELKLKESTCLEYKSTNYLKKGLIEERDYIKNGLIRGTHKEKIDKKEDVLIRPLVSFLNKFSDEGGLLILGIYDRDGFPEKIASAKKELFSTEQLRSWIHSNISSVPPMKDFPFIDIKKTINEENPIFLIEIHPIDIHVVYFSKITNNVYSRKNDTSVTESLLDVYRLISNKKCAKVFIELKKEREKNVESVLFRLNFLYKNKGFEPGEHVRTILNFILKKGDPKKIKINPSREWKPAEKGSNYAGFLSSFQAEVWAKDIIYPNVPMKIGNVEIKLGKDEGLLMGILTHEKKGRSFQRFDIDYRKILLKEEEFNTYI